MSEANESQGLPSPAEDPQGFMAKMREQLEANPPEADEPEAVETEPEPVEEAPAAQAATPEPVQTDWREAPIPDDVAETYRFFKGKKTGDLFESYRNIEGKFQEQGRRLSQLETELAAAKTLRDMLHGAAGPQAPKEIDPYAAAGFDPNVDPVVRPKEWNELQEKRFAQQAEETAKRVSAEAIREAALEQQAAAVGEALSAVQAKLGLDDKSFQRFVPAIVDQAFTDHGKQGLASADNLLNSFKKVLDVGNERASKVFTPPQPAAPVAPAVPPPAGNPPGAKRPAPGTEAPRSSGPTLGAERARMLRQMADNLKRQNEWTDEAAEQFFQNAARELAGGKA